VTHIAIGPQGVCGAQRVEFRVVILFPWDPAQELFGGDRAHVDLPAR
jgi:hypothetical protein